MPTLTIDTPVPSSITFESDLLFVPTSDEIGIPDELAMLARFQPQVRMGQWVKRGEPLLTVTFTFFNRETEARWSWLRGDRMSLEPRILTSPVSGLVLGFRRQRASVPAAYGGGVYYDEEDVLPVLLMPKDEPPQDYWNIKFYEWMGKLIRDYWKRLAFYRKDCGYIRLGDRVQESAEDWARALRGIAAFREPNREAFEVRAMSDQDHHSLSSNVQTLRAHDLVLRDKLVHLTKRA